MKYPWAAVALSLACATAFALTCRAEDGASLHFGRLSLFTHGIPSSAPQTPAAATASPRYTPRTDGYAVGFGSDARKAVSGRLELQQFDYFVDENLKGERKRTSVMFTMRVRF